MQVQENVNRKNQNKIPIELQPATATQLLGHRWHISKFIFIWLLGWRHALEMNAVFLLCLSYLVQI